MAQTTKTVVPVPCVLQIPSNAEILTPSGKIFVSHSEFGDPLRDCVGLIVKRGSITIVVYEEEGKKRLIEVKSPQTVSAAMLIGKDVAQGTTWNLGVFWNILTGNTGEAQGYSRGSEGGAAMLAHYLNGPLLFDAEERQIDLRTITDSVIDSFTLTTNNARRTVINGVSLNGGVLRIGPGALDAGHSYRWTARVDGVEIVGEWVVSPVNVTAQIGERLTPRALGSSADSPQYLARRAIVLDESGYRADALLAAQKWIRVR